MDLRSWLRRRWYAVSAENSGREEYWELSVDHQPARLAARVHYAVARVCDAVDRSGRFAQMVNAVLRRASYSPLELKADDSERACYRQSEMAQQGRAD